MREVAEFVRKSVAAGHSARVGRVVAFKGFGGRRAGEAIVLTEDGSSAGQLLGGIADDAIAASAGEGPAELVEVAVGDTDAVAAGLACGGVATVLSSEVAALPEALWSALAADMPVALVTRPDWAAAPGALVLVDDATTGQLERYGSVGDADLDELAETAARGALRRGSDSTEVLVTQGVRFVVEGYFPTTTLVVVGEGSLAEALVAQGGMLSWSVAIESEWHDQADARIRALGRADALVVLSHDHELGTAALAAGLASSCYLGALGSRHTQERRRGHLAARGVAAEELDRIHGPVGLDLGARTPEETAVSIVAEILAHRSGRRPGALSATTGPING